MPHLLGEAKTVDTQGKYDLVHPQMSTSSRTGHVFPSQQLIVHQAYLVG